MIDQKPFLQVLGVRNFDMKTSALPVQRVRYPRSDTNLVPSSGWELTFRPRFAHRSAM